ncbi:hypothetical protein NUSPORA_00804 [Nucleospora cyclopteri]
MKLVKKIKLNHNVYKLTFQSSEKLEEMQVSSCVKIYDDKGNFRFYTPISKKDYELVFSIKEYPTGLLSKYICNLPINRFINISHFLSKRKYIPNEFNKILFVAGGTGLTPCTQVIFDIVENKNDKTDILLINCNTTEQDVFLNDLLNNLNSIDSVEIKQVITSKTGHLTASHLNNLCNGKKYDFVYVCGPPGFMKTVSGDKTADKKQGELKGVLKELEYSENTVYKF